MNYQRLVFLLIATLFCTDLSAQKILPIQEGWSSTSINAVVFRKNSVVTHQNHQYASFYDAEGYVILAKRELSSEDWEIKKTRFQGNIEDAHNSISIMIDGDGYLHMAWDHHGDTLNYAKGIQSGSLEMTDRIQMTGTEIDVTYPEFFKMPSGDLLFFYRSGISGRGNLVINRYDLRNRQWERVQDVLISGEDKRNAYWQTFVDANGSIHISWVWRETWDVETNHDLSYAKSKDGGKTWMNSKGEVYDLPITLSSAEVIAEIPQNSELINQTSMYADEKGRPYIATYWKEEEDVAPQFRLVYQDEEGWHTTQVGKRILDFSLSGGGTKKIPISRPQIMVSSGENPTVYIVYRDDERGSKVSVSFAELMGKNNWSWETKDLTDESVGSWEPTFDTEQWRLNEELHLYVQKVGQGDGETQEEIPPQLVKVLVWKP